MKVYCGGIVGIGERWADRIFMLVTLANLSWCNCASRRRAGVRLGFELETALVVEPDYIALGPIYPTTLKAMKWGRRRGATVSPSGNIASPAFR